MLLDDGKWHSFRLPKSSHSYDGAHGWNTEWPRIRDIGEDALLMTMHGSFWKFPRSFAKGSTSGISPRSNYIKVVGDFCRWKDRIVLGCDDAAKSEFLNKHELKGTLAGPGQSQSNLWFLEPSQLDGFGPALGRGAVWMQEEVKSGTPSEPFLFSGFSKRGLHLSHAGKAPVVVTLEIDKSGDGTWAKHSEVEVAPGASVWKEFDSNTHVGAWIRLTTGSNATGMTAFFHYRNEDKRGTELPSIAAGLASPALAASSTGVMIARGAGFKTLRYVSDQGGTYDLNGDLKLIKVDDAKGTAWTSKNGAIPKPIITTDAASLIYADSKGKRWRLPKGADGVNPPNADRVCREICTERNLLNVGGTFYELPAENAGGFAKLRPIATHNLRIHDYTSYRGLLVMSGVTNDAGGDHIVRSDDGKAALWVGGVDDLWQFGKPRGEGGPWKNSKVKAGQPCDAYLATGYDRKELTLSHKAGKAVVFHIEADITGTGHWSRIASLEVAAGETKKHVFPESFGAYWLRLVSGADTTATATFRYD